MPPYKVENIKSTVHFDSLDTFAAAPVPEVAASGELLPAGGAGEAADVVGLHVRIELGRVLERPVPGQDQ